MRREFNLHYVFYFLDVANTCSISRSAERLHVSQPTLSSAITTLEHELGIRLFDRVGRNRIVLNRFGKEFYEGASTAFRTLHDTVDRICDMAEECTGTVRFSVPHAALLSATLHLFSQEYPSVKLHQSITDLGTTYTMLMNGDLDFSISYLPLDSSDCQWHPLLQMPLQALLSANHPLANESRLSVSRFSGEELVFCTSTNLYPDLIRFLCLKAGFEPECKYIGSDADMAAHSIFEGGVCLCWAPDNREIISRGHTQAGLKLLPVDSDYLPALGYITRRNCTLSKASEILLRCIDDWSQHYGDTL